MLLWVLSLRVQSRAPSCSILCPRCKKKIKVGGRIWPLITDGAWPDHHPPIAQDRVRTNCPANKYKQQGMDVYSAIHTAYESLYNPGLSQRTSLTAVNSDIFTTICTRIIMINNFVHTSICVISQVRYNGSLTFFSLSALSWLNLGIQELADKLEKRRGRKKNTLNLSAEEM